MSTDTLKASARLTVTSGPDRGRSVDLTEEVTHLGSEAGNEIVLADPQLGAAKVSILRRQGRHAIRVEGSSEVEVDRAKVPPDQWIWLPKSAQLRLTRRTAVEFVCLLPETGDNSPTTPVTPPPQTAAPTKPRMRGNPTPEGAKTKRAGQVAKFITDQQGDTLVRLGEDGHYPELQLLEGPEVNKRAATKSTGGNSLLLVLGFVVSVGMSVLMLFVDMEPTGSTGAKKAVARQALRAFYGGTQEPLDKYQLLLREAQQAWSRGNRAEEMRKYREVLDLLRSERNNPLTGLTHLAPEDQQVFTNMKVRELGMLSGDVNFLDLKNDEKLERLLAIVLENR